MTRHRDWCFCECTGKTGIVLKRIVLGAMAGILATMPMSAVIWGLRHAGVYHSKPPPETGRGGNRMARLARLPEPRRSRWQPLKLAQHFGFGSAAGAGFSLVSPVLRPKILAGMLVGIGIWLASYAGWIPALGILPPPQKDEKGRMFTMIVAHVVYGLTLGAIASGGLCVQRHPDSPAGSRLPHVA